MAYKRKSGVMAEINVTPLTDVFLVLLIITMVVAPAATQARQNIQAPDVKQGGQLDSSWPMVEVEASGTMYFDGKPVTAELLPTLLAARVGQSPEKKLVIRGDESSGSGAVLDVLRMAREAGFEDALIAGNLTPVPVETLGITAPVTP